MSGRSRASQFRPGVVAAILLIVAGVALSAGLLLVDRIGEAIIAERQREVAASARDYFVAFAHEEGLAPLARALDRRERSRGREAFRYALFANDGVMIGGVNLLPIEALPGPGISEVTIQTAGRATPWEVLVQPISIGGTLVVYEDLAERGSFRAALVIGSFVAMVIALGAVLAVSLWLNRLIYRRAETIAATAGQIAEGKTSARVPTDPNGDVFDRLGVAINAMLDRNDELMTGLRTVTDSLAHDLRSPLTRMKAALSRALEPDADDGVRLGNIGEAWDQADRALATTSALLDIARAETGLSRDMFEAVNLGDLANDVAELFGPTLEDAGQSFEVEIDDVPVIVSAHELLLRQAIGNLLFNAARYGGEGARVRLTVDMTPGFARCIVADTGPGIPEADRGRVLERFVRLDTARTAQGSGLGLAIAAACAKLHRGRLTLEDNQPGLRVVLELAR